LQRILQRVGSYPITGLPPFKYFLPEESILIASENASKSQCTLIHQRPRNAECGTTIEGIKNPLDSLRFHDLRHSTATKLLEQGTPFAVVADILGWSASTAIRMAKRYGHIRPEAQRQALAGIATEEISEGVHQFVHQPEGTLESRLRN
jgi:Phage integrase family